MSICTVSHSVSALLFYLDAALVVLSVAGLGCRLAWT